MNDLISSGLVDLVLSAVTAVALAVAAFALANLIRVNKGAKINRAWGLLAFGAACLALASLDRTLEGLGLPNAARARTAISALGGLLVAFGAMYGRGLYKSLLK